VPPYLSKSRLLSAWQCGKKLHLEKHHPELGVISPQTEALFATGNEVGDIAQQLYGTDQSIEIAFDFKTMLGETKRLFANGAGFPIFEATFRYEGVLIRADVMIPDGDGWRVIEVKASTSVKDYHVLDCAIQYWVLRNCGINVKSISLAHVNNQFVYRGDGDYHGLLLEHDLTNEARDLERDVLELVAQARDAVSGPMPLISVGAHCSHPYECQFMSYCWPVDAEYPVTGLGGNKAKLAEWVIAGYRDIRDVSADELNTGLQQRIHRVTVSGAAEVIPGAQEIISAMPYPRYYLDFETISPAVPLWAGTRPYAAVPVQWSCHVEQEAGELGHEEFLDLSGEPPMRSLAATLIACLGNSGPVLMYTSYEKSVINGLIELYPELEKPLQAIIDRLVDLHPIVKTHYYHPRMLGSWSIKAVLPTMVPAMSYAGLEGINEGTAASDGYLEAIRPETDPARKAELKEQLLRYCRFDTLAMVEVVRYLCRSGAGENRGYQRHAPA
jgi:hypothetical protein